MRINQTQISAETFHPSCLMLDSEAIFERITNSDSDIASGTTIRG